VVAYAGCRAISKSHHRYTLPHTILCSYLRASLECRRKPSGGAFMKPAFTIGHPPRSLTCRNKTRRPGSRLRGRKGTCHRTASIYMYGATKSPSFRTRTGEWNCGGATDRGERRRLFISSTENKRDYSSTQVSSYSVIIFKFPFSLINSINS